MTLPELGTPVDSLPPGLTLVRDLEAFEGPILTEYRGARSSVYVEKWCARSGQTERWLLVRSDPRAVAEYLAGRITMLDLFTTWSDGIGFLVDRSGDKVKSLSVAALAQLPPKYLPKAHAKHDESLRPEWDVAPQSFLIGDDWDTPTIWAAEKLFRELYAFAYFLDPKRKNVDPPSEAFGVTMNGGISVVHALGRLRDAVPKHARATSRVAASSPGVLTIEAQARPTEVIHAGIQSLKEAEKAYDILHEWSKLDANAVKDVPKEAAKDVMRLSEQLGLDGEKLLRASRPDPKLIDVLVAGKMLAAYYVRLKRIFHPAEGVEFISAANPADEDDDDDDDVDDDDVDADE